MKTHVITAAAIAALFSTTAMAETFTIKQLPEEGSVTVSGVVEYVKNEREFTLRDDSGTVGVDIESSQSLVLKKGDPVTVTGMVDKGVAGKDINASKVDIHKGMLETVGDAVKSIPGVSTTDAQAFNIGDLPSQGMVKVTGVVTKVDDEKEFTLKDKTGSINVEMEHAEKAALTKGAEVTVIGSVDKGFFRKDINATEVIVISSAQPTAQK